MDDIVLMFETIYFAHRAYDEMYTVQQTSNLTNTREYITGSTDMLHVCCTFMNDRTGILPFVIVHIHVGM